MDKFCLGNISYINRKRFFHNSLKFKINFYSKLGKVHNPLNLGVNAYHIY